MGNRELEFARWAKARGPHEDKRGAKGLGLHPRRSSGRRRSNDTTPATHVACRVGLGRNCSILTANLVDLVHTLGQKATAKQGKGHRLGMESGTGV